MQYSNKIQGGYYLLTGIWPVLHIRSFMAITGGKTDIWLVKMVGLLSVATGLALVANSRNQQTLGFATAIAFAAIDLNYSFNGTISPVYLFDAVFQFIFMIILISRKPNPHSSKQSPIDQA